jgi:stage II sporulation protein D
LFAIVGTIIVLAALVPAAAAGSNSSAGSGTRSVPAAASPATSAPTTISTAMSATSLAGSVTFYGRGYGHGVGLSQYGARGRALAGQDTAAILAHYYAGTSTGSIPTSTKIRVLVLTRWVASAASPLVVYGRSKPWTIDGIDRTFPADARLTLRPTITTTEAGTTVSWRLRVAVDGVTTLSRAMNHSFRIRAPNSGGRLELASKHSSFDTYRGVLRILPSTTAPTVNAVNEIRLEMYLRGVVPAEMPPTWPAAALQAQAIVARSYAARRLRPGVSSYDIGDDTRSQVYHGVIAERSGSNAAISATSGQVLMSGSSFANTLYHSTGGGATENNENVFVSATGEQVASPVSYLRGSSDRTPAGASFDAASPYATWKTATYTVTQLSAWFGSDARTKVGTLQAIDLSNRGVSGRLISVTLVGLAGTRTVSGDVFRSVFNARRPTGDPSMRSTLVDLKPVP